MISDVQTLSPTYKIQVRDQFSTEQFQFGEHIGERMYPSLRMTTKQSMHDWEEMSTIYKMPYEGRMKMYESATQTMMINTIEKIPETVRQQLTHVVTVSVTGMTVPSHGHFIKKHFNLPATTKIYGMQDAGCVGGVRGTALATSLAKEAPGNKVLLVCCEVSTLHARHCTRKDISGVVGNVLFGDGLVCSVVDHPDNESAQCGKGQGLVVEETKVVTIPDTWDDMTWRMGPHCYNMYLSKKIIASIEANVLEAIQGMGIDMEDTYWVVHPGGAGILDAVIRALGLEKNALDVSFDVLGTRGNMSSSTILYILRDTITKIMQDKTGPRKKNMVMMAFGPGMMIEMLRCKVPEDLAVPESVDDTWRTTEIFYKKPLFSKVVGKAAIAAVGIAAGLCTVGALYAKGVGSEKSTPSAPTLV
jgi:predicted naringenin-chalcone synthase